MELRARPTSREDLGGGRLLLQGLGEVGVLGLQLGEEPRVLDGDRRPGREGLHQGDLAVGERPDLVPVDDDHPEQLVRPEHGDGHDAPVGVDLGPAVRVLGIGLDVVHVDDTPLEGGPGGGAAAPGRDGIALDEVPELRGDVVTGHPAQDRAVKTEDEGAFGLAQPDRVLGQRLEDRLEIEGGPPDHLEELAGRRLLLEGGLQLAIAGLQLGEQANVLDGDDGLIGEGLEEGDLTLGEELAHRCGGG